MLPNFFLAGAPKCGTSSMARWLGEHPQVYFCPGKEPHYFTYEGEKRPHWAVKTLDEYEALFAGAGPQHLAVGEGSTWYLHSATAPQRIAERVPHARIIVSLRNPADRAYSSWLFRVQSGWESIASFEEALDAEERRAAEGAEWDFLYAGAGFYAAQLRRWLRFFPRERIFVGIFDDMVADPRAYMRAIHEFLGVDPSFVPAVEERHNVTRAPGNAALHRMLVRPSRAKEALKAVLPEGVRSRLASIREWNMRSPPPMKPDTRARLVERFRDDIRDLESIAQRDLSAWLAS